MDNGDDCMDAGGRVTQDAKTDDCMDAGGRVTQDAKTDDCMDAGGRVTQDAKTDSLSSVTGNRRRRLRNESSAFGISFQEKVPRVSETNILVQFFGKQTLPDLTQQRRNASMQRPRPKRNRARNR